MKVLLILPGFRYAKPRTYESPPLGLGYLAAAVREAGGAAAVIDAHAEGLDLNALAARARAFAPDIIGVSVTTEARHAAARLIARLKRLFPRALLVAGGPHPTLSPQDTMEGIPGLDVIVRGEGEGAIAEIMACAAGTGDYASVPGISWRRGNSIIHNAPRQVIADIDRIPFPDRSLFRLDKYDSVVRVPEGETMRFTGIITSRGCPRKCAFCASSAFWDGGLRSRSTGNIIEEIKQVIDRYGIRGFSIEDDTFFLEPARVRKFCAALKRGKIAIRWFCFVRVDTLTRELLKSMKEAGCFHVIFGAESGSDETLRAMGKGITTEQVRQVSAWCRDLGIDAERLFIVGFPGETYEQAEKTLEFMEELDGYGGSNFLSVLRIYPGTEIERWAMRQGVLPRDFSWMDGRAKNALTMPSTLGDAPLALGQMTWPQVSDIVFRWAARNRYPVHMKAWAALRDVRSLRDLGALASAGIRFLKYRMAS